MHMVIMGIDPGTAATGWGVIRYEGQKAVLIDCGIIQTVPRTPMSKRLLTIFNDISGLLKKFKPESLVIEELFFNTNAKTALVVGQARGVVMIAGEKYGCDIFSYTPLQVKMAITGYGRADKNQIQQMVQKLLKLPQIIKPDDAADAVAIALTHGFTANFIFQH